MRSRKGNKQSNQRGGKQPATILCHTSKLSGGRCA